LLENALNHAVTKIKLEVEFERILRKLTIRVKDDGPGMSKSKLASIF
jgi:signal transduction histidine kinase